MHAGVAPSLTTNQGNSPAPVQKEKQDSVNFTSDLKASFSQFSILSARKPSSEKSASSAVSCFLSWSNQDNFIKCSRISDGEKLYDFCLEQDNISNQNKSAARGENDQQKQHIQNLQLLPVFANSAAANNDSEVHFWTQTENRVRVYSALEIGLLKS